MIGKPHSFNESKKYVAAKNAQFLKRIQNKEQ